MKYGIISDIHGNSEALKVALRHLDSIGVDTCVCLGDVVGYGASPNECFKLVRETAESIIAGNHDYAALGKTDLSQFNQYARQAAIWTQQSLETDHRDYIETLPLTIEMEHALGVHATPGDPEQWYYLFTPPQFLSAFDDFQEKICFIGHSHQPIVFEQRAGSSGPVGGKRISLVEDARYIVNVGSVGQPRDNDPRLCCCVYDSGDMTVELVRLEYNIKQAQKDIREAALPEFLAQRLAYGE